MSTEPINSKSDGIATSGSVIPKESAVPINTPIPTQIERIFNQTVGVDVFSIAVIDWIGITDFSSVIVSESSRYVSANFTDMSVWRSELYMNWSQFTICIVTYTNNISWYIKRLLSVGHRNENPPNFSLVTPPTLYTLHCGIPGFVESHSTLIS